MPLVWCLSHWLLLCSVPLLTGWCSCSEWGWGFSSVGSASLLCFVLCFCLVALLAEPLEVVECVCSALCAVCFMV